MDEIENMLPDQVTVTVAGETLVLEAFKTKHMRVYSRTERTIAEKAVALGVEMQALLGRTPTPDEIPVDRIMEACYDEFVERIQAATGKPKAWVEELGIDETVQLAGLISQLNAQRYNPKKVQALTVAATAQSQ